MIYYKKPVSNTIIIINYQMGACMQHKRSRVSDMANKSLSCPMCLSTFDDQQRKAQQICSLPHPICATCITSVATYNTLNKRSAHKCPVCKEGWSDEKLKNILNNVDGNIREIENAIKIIPEDRRKLFVFTTIYLPALNKMIKDNSKLESIDAVRIKGKMIDEYQVFQMEMFDCLVNLRRLYLKNSFITAINTDRCCHNKLQILNFTNTKIASMDSVLIENKEAFKFLRQLTLKGSQIGQICSLEEFKYLQILDLSYNKIQNMNGLNNLQELKDLNLQFNNITSLVYFLPFKNLMSLSLFGNQLALSAWDAFLDNNWSQLRLLTVTVNAQDAVSKLGVHKKLKNKKWQYMQLIIAQMEESENIADFLKKDIFKDHLYLIEIAREDYEFYLSKCSRLSKQMKKAKRYDRLGANINFKAVHVNKMVYEINDNLNIIKKIAKSTEKNDYLFHSQTINVKDQQPKQISFRTRSKNMVFGIVFDESNQIGIDLGRRICRYMDEDEEQLSDKYNQILKQDQQVDYTLTVDSKNRQIVVYCKKIKIYHRSIDSIQKQYTFFIHLQDEGDFITVEKLEGE